LDDFDKHTFCDRRRALTDADLFKEARCPGRVFRLTLRKHSNKDVRIN